MSDNNDIAIKVDGVYKDFNLPHEANNNLKQSILHPLKRKTTEKQHALKDISFEINKGDFFGIVGRNGSGKSTLLKIIAGIYAPSRGSVSVNGSLTPFIELGVGFNAELTGRENVFLNGAMLGFSKKEMEDMYNEIVEFAELEKFMDQKLKNYSSGMQVRLAFSVAIRAKSDILLLDEVLAVGDSVFQQKCFAYFKELKRNKQTVILVTHDMSTIQQFCNRTLYIKDSKILSEGKPSKIAALYNTDVYSSISSSKVSQNNENEVSSKRNRWGSNKFSIKKFKVTNLAKVESKHFRNGDTVVLNFQIERGLSDKDERLVYGFTIKQPGESPFTSYNTLREDIKTIVIKKDKESVNAKISFQANFGQRTLLISPAIADSYGNEIYDWIEDAVELVVSNDIDKDSLVTLSCDFKEQVE